MARGPWEADESGRGAGACPVRVPEAFSGGCASADWGVGPTVFTPPPVVGRVSLSQTCLGAVFFCRRARRAASATELFCGDGGSAEANGGATMHTRVRTAAATSTRNLFMVLPPYQRTETMLALGRRGCNRLETGRHQRITA